jgi:hypothetical protein
MKVYDLSSEKFKKYGRIVGDIDFSGLIEAMNNTPCPDDVIYVPDDEVLEKLPVYKDLTEKTYGELPIQIGYCNGHNCMLNALEYHRSSEINVAATDMILMLGSQQDITDEYTYDTSLVEAFLVPKGTAVEVYATTLHYAPCGVDNEGFKVAVVLPKGTNYDLDNTHNGGEDGHLTAKNKWLLGHPEGGLPQGSPMGLVGKNLDINE